MFWASLRIAFVISAVAAWVIEYKDKQRLAATLDDLQEKYFNDRPQLALVALSAEGHQDWQSKSDSKNPPVIFSLRHVSGRPATNVRFDPISSEKGTYSLRFNPTPVVMPPVQHGMSYEVWDSGGKPDIRTIEYLGWGALLRDFFYDCDRNKRLHDYILTVRFIDRGDDRIVRFLLKFDSKEYRLLTPEVMPLGVPLET